jgi:hypothetical protein
MRFLLADKIERTFIESLPKYLMFMQRVGKLDPPFNLESGLHNVKGRVLVTSSTPDNSRKIYDESFELRRTLNDVNLKTQTAFLLEFFSVMHKQTGYPRPNKFNNFPP